MLDGDATQVPSETVRTCPLSLVPETVGLAVTTGALVMIAVEAVNWVEVPISFFASTLANTCRPMLDTPAAKAADSDSATGIDEVTFLPDPSSPEFPSPQQRTS